MDALLGLVLELKESAEAMQPAENARALPLLLPVYHHLFQQVPVSFQSDSQQQRIRMALLELIQRTPFASELFRPHAHALMRLVMDVLTTDNEENAAICLRVIIEVHKSCRGIHELEEFVTPFFDFVKSMLENMEEIMRNTLDNSLSSGPTTRQSRHTAHDSVDSMLADSDGPREYAPSHQSFKVLAECPIILVLLIQIHKRFISSTVPAMVPLIIGVISLRASAQSEWINLNPELGPIQLGPAPSITARAAYADFIAAQVKIMSFLAYIIKGFAAMLKPQENIIAGAVIHLLTDCPAEASATRKELLVAARHILSTDFRAAFVQYLDVMFMEDVLVGNSITSRETLRPLAYSMLADLIHHVRTELKQDQIVKTAVLYIRNLHDASLAPSIQTMCAKLLLNLIDCIASNSQQVDDSEESRKEMGRRVLIRMLDAFAAKFAFLKSIVPKLTKRASVSADSTIDQSDMFNTDPSLIIDVEHLAPIATSSVGSDHHQTDISKDYKFLFKTLVLGLKTIMYGIRNMTQQQPNRLLGYEEQHLFVDLFENGIACFELYRVEAPTAEDAAVKAAAGRSVLVQKEEKEILEHFVTVFTLIDPAVFHQVFSLRIDFFFDALVAESALLTIPQYLLASEVVSKNFSGVLMQFLMSRLEQLGGSNTAVSSMILRLFKLVFMAVTLFPEMNEPMLQPHITDLITRSMKLAANAEEPNNYYFLLRALFRNIGGGRYETLYKEVLPLLPALLRDFNVLLQSTKKSTSRDLFVELCLTVPVRLSVLLPYLHFLMKPLVIALQAGPELVSQGLRTLELCVDNLTAEFLDPILKPVIKEMMMALWKHLKPLPYNSNHAHSTLRILGKMGGRNRRILDEALRLKHHDYSAATFDLPVPVEGFDKPLILHLDKSLRTACELLVDTNAPEATLKESFGFLKSCLPLLIDTSSDKEKMAAIWEHRCKEISSSTRANRDSERARLEELLGSKLSKTNYTENLTPEARALHTESLQLVLEHLIYAGAVEAVAAEAKELMRHLANHFAFLKVAEHFTMNVTSYRTTKQNKDADCIDSNVFVEALVGSITSDMKSAFEVAEQVLVDFHDALKFIIGDEEAANKLSVFHMFATRFCSSCYKPEWFVKLGGCRGIYLLSSRLGSRWVIDHELEFIKAIIYTLKDMPSDLAATTIKEVEQTFTHILKMCNDTKDGEVSNERQVAKFAGLMGLLTTELLNPNEVVRKNVQDALKSLAGYRSTTVTALLEPYKERLVTPIFSKPIRALPFAMQIGRIDAITFCLSLEPQFLEFNDELVRLLTEAIALADAEDSSITSRGSQHRHAALLTNLRLVCVRLLSVAMSLNEFSDNQALTKTRFKIVQVFLKSLYSKSPEVVEAAKKGTRQALSLQHHRLPKELLEEGLRPILSKLSDPKRLTPDGLAGLARLLELLSQYFKVEIGRKLLEHLDVWATPQTLEAAASKPITESIELQVIVGVLELIHLLPSAASMFLDDMIKKVIQLEDGIRRTLTSPFRKPLAKFLNRYAAESFQYFLTNIEDLRIGQLFVDLLDHPDSPELKVQLMQNTDNLMNVSFLSDESRINARVVAALVIERVSQKDPKFLKEHESVFEVIVDYWRTVDRQSIVADEAETNLAQYYHWKRIIHILLMYSQVSHDDVDALFDVLDVFSMQTTIDYSFVKRFIQDDVITNFSTEIKKLILQRFFEGIENEEYETEKVITLLRLLIVPLLVVSYADPNNQVDIITDDMIKLAHKFIWAPKVANVAAYGSSLDENWLQVEYFQFTAVVLKHCGKLVNPYRKDVIQSAWNFLKHEDSILRYTAYVVICYFICSFDVPEKMILQVLRSLLRTYQSESRLLVRQSLDILYPHLPNKLRDEGGDTAPSWIRWPRKILVEDHHLLAQSVVIWQTIIRYPDLFYDYRSQFVQLIVTSLGKYGLASSATAETKLLSIDLVDLILKWEKRRLNGSDMDEDKPDTPTSRKRKAVSTSASPKKKPQRPQDPEEAEFTPPNGLREIILNFLLRLICAIHEPQSRKGWCDRILDLAKALLSSDMWSESNVKLGFLDKFFKSTDITEQNSTVIPYILDMVKLIFGIKNEDYVAQNLPYMQSVIEKCFATENVKVIDPIFPVMEEAYKKLWSRSMLGDISGVNDFIHNFANESIQTGKGVYAVVHLLKAISPYYAPSVSITIPALIKLLQKQCKEYPVGGAPSLVPITTSIIKTLLEILYPQIEQLGDHKRMFFSCIASLIEKSNEEKIHRAILSIIDTYVFTDKGASLTMKEKALLIQKFALLESRANSSVMDAYLSMILRIYRDEHLARTELTVRLESIFLLGTRSDNLGRQKEFLAVFDKNLPKNLYLRMSYVLGIQNWDQLGNYFWIRQALSILFNVIKSDADIESPVSWCYQTVPVTYLDADVGRRIQAPRLKSFVSDHLAFLDSLSGSKIGDFLPGLRQFSFRNVEVAHDLWVSMFEFCWRMFSPKERHDMTKYFIALITKDYHQKQIDQRPNVMQTLLHGASRCCPTMILPPQVIKYLAKTFNAWHVGLELLQLNLMALDSESHSFKEPSKIRDSCLDAIQELYSLLSEDDYSIGSWKRRSVFDETNSALAYEQLGMWQEAQNVYEAAQMKARNGLLPFIEAEYSLWEDRWISCTQKLQQWDLCADLAKHDNNVELQLECSWRITDWYNEKESLQHAIALISDNPTPRHKVFEAFLGLSQLQDQPDKLSEITKICDDGIQLSLRRWHSLPRLVSQSHMPTLHMFQQFVELQEASHIYIGLMPATRLQSANELKGTLGTWRDRLPNMFDDINIWSELVAWRQHVFAVINKAYQAVGDQQNTMNYRGYHEIAWIINRFAHVARKHHLTEVCVNALTKIYTLPNIEIHDAFLKLKEQSKCFFQNPKEYANGLEVINNTNLAYFQQPQRAEFFALKGVFLSKLNGIDDANTAFSSAIQIDTNLPKGWTCWALFNDRLFREKEDITWAANAVNCYLHAAGLYKSSRSRKYLLRVLWLLSLDDAQETVSKAFEAYKGDLVPWYWITFIPQLLGALTRKEARMAKNLLIRIAKAYPQALYFGLRTTRQDYADLRKKRGLTTSVPASAAQSPTGNDDMDVDTDTVEAIRDQNESSDMDGIRMSNSQDFADNSDAPPGTPRSQTADEGRSQSRKAPWTYVDEIMSILKTAYPLLSLSMETTVDQILMRLKLTPDEEVYRVVMALLTESFQPLINAIASGKIDAKIPQTLMPTIEKLIQSPYVISSQFKDALYEDFIASQPTLDQVVARYRVWRDRLKRMLDNRACRQSLENFSPYLVEFEYQKFEDIEIPGQYLELRDSNDDFVRIERFLPHFDYVHGPGIWYRRIVMQATDGTQHVFNIHNPSSRHARREERMVQCFRLLNGVLEKRRESRKRNLAFQLPHIIPLSPTVRLVQDDLSAVSLQGISEDHCERSHLPIDGALVYLAQTMKEFVQKNGPFESSQKLAQFNLEVFEQIRRHHVPDDIVSKYFLRNMASFTDFWMLKKNVATSLAAAAFMSHVFYIGHRLPHKLVFSKASGKMHMTEMLPLLSMNTLNFQNSEPVPFRLTPNLQRLMGTAGLEGPFVGSLVSIAAALTEPGFELENYLSVFVRDELFTWRNISGIRIEEVTPKVFENCEKIVERVKDLYKKSETMPVCQPVVNLVAEATDPGRLCNMDSNWQPWL